jgi:3-methyladenine DNA glycosylase/8-oxoguanine DNA glycosylase
MTDVATVSRAKRDPSGLDARRRKAATIADPKAREVLQKADPIPARLIDGRPDFRPRAWMAELPPLDAFGTLVFRSAECWRPYRSLAVSYLFASEYHE